LSFSEYMTLAGDGHEKEVDAVRKDTELEVLFPFPFFMRVMVMVRVRVRVRVVILSCL
jgi:hypothetical protein